MPVTEVLISTSFGAPYKSISQWILRCRADFAVRTKKNPAISDWILGDFYPAIALPRTVLGSNCAYQNLGKTEEIFTKLK